MTQLTEHFSLEELIFSSTAVRLGIDNAPSPDVVTNLTTLANGLELVRTLLGNQPMHIDSGYRSAQLNQQVGGVPSSAHVQGYAADFICPEFGTPLQIVQAIARSDIQYDQVIQEGNWVHLSVAPTLRGQVLTAHFDDGIATYTAGVAQ
jgi:hypothetical protein